MVKATEPIMRLSLIIAAACAPLVGFTADYAIDRAEVLKLAELCNHAPAIHAAEGFKTDGDVHAIFYDALPWNGKPTRAFAWIGLPAKREGKVPGMVLIHGGGGTAYKEWVQKWNDQGFAAISIAVEGQTDATEKKDAKARPTWWAWPGCSSPIPSGRARRWAK